MRKTAILFSALVVLFLSPQIANAQSDTDRTKEDKEGDNIGDRISKKIEGFVSEITHELMQEGEIDSLSADTLPSKSKVHEVDLNLEEEQRTETYEGGFIVNEDRTMNSNVVV